MFDTDLIKTALSHHETIGVVQISTKEAVISRRIGDYEEVVYRLTSGIGGRHNKGGQSSQRFQRNREEQIKQFFHRIHLYMDKLSVSRWIYKGDKEIIKKYEMKSVV